MTPREHLALMADAELAHETVGDEGPAIEHKSDDDGNLAFMLRASLTLKRIEKRVDLLYELPEIVAAVERYKTRKVL